MIRHSFLFQAILLAFVAAGIAGCAHDHTHDHGHDHGHDHNAATDAHDHAEGAALWGWSPRCEAFIDITSVEPEVPAQWLVHMTDPATGEPMDNVVMILTTTASGEASMVKPRHRDNGLYIAEVQMPSAGTYGAELRWETGDRSGVLDLGLFTTGTDLPHEEPPATAVALTKEQVWQVPFAVEKAEYDTIRQQIKAAGVWLPAPGDEWVMNASAAGTVMYAKPELVPGVSVAAGEVLFVLSAGDIKEAGAEAERVAALAEFEAADAAKRRLKSLREAGAATLGEWEEAQRRWEVAKEARDRWVDLGVADVVRVRAERAGVIRSVGVTQGAYVQPGQSLARLASEPS